MPNCQSSFSLHSDAASTQKAQCKIAVKLQPVIFHELQNVRERLQVVLSSVGTSDCSTPEDQPPKVRWEIINVSRQLARRGVRQHESIVMLKPQRTDKD